MPGSLLRGLGRTFGYKLYFLFSNAATSLTVNGAATVIAPTIGGSGAGGKGGGGTDPC
jgi:hypothetical protein